LDIAIPVLKDKGHYTEDPDKEKNEKEFKECKI